MNVIKHVFYQEIWKSMSTVNYTPTALSSLFTNLCFCPVLSSRHPESGLLKSVSGALTEIIKKFFMNLLNILKCFNLGGELFRLTLQADNRNIYFLCICRIVGLIVIRSTYRMSRNNTEISPERTLPCTIPSDTDSYSDMQL